jgi:hypothetical protein
MSVMFEGSRGKEWDEHNIIEKQQEKQVEECDALAVNALEEAP